MKNFESDYTRDNFQLSIFLIIEELLKIVVVIPIFIFYFPVSKKGQRYCKQGKAHATVTNTMIIIG